MNKTLKAEYPPKGAVFMHGIHQVQVYAVDKKTGMIGIQYINGIYSAIPLGQYLEETGMDS